jgi:hypothetical protein
MSSWHMLRSCVQVWEASKFQFMNEDSAGATGSGAAVAPGHVTAAGLSAVAGRGPAAV